MARVRPSLLRVGLLLGLLSAGPASALSFYGEILTSQQAPLFSDIRASATLTVNFNPFEFDWTGMGGSPGLGDGLVTPSDSLAFQHLYDPTPDSASITRAWLGISVVDDELLDPPENAWVLLDEDFWQSGQATLNFFFGDITALGLITTDGDTIDVEVQSTTGDFIVLASGLKVEFVPVPEPGSAGLVLLGTALLALRRRG